MARPTVATPKVRKSPRPMLFCSNKSRTNFNGRRKRTVHNRRNHPRIRIAIVACCISGLLVAISLSLYLVLAFFNQDQSPEVHVLSIIIILITALFFLYTLVRISILILNAKTTSRPARPDNRMAESYNYANSILSIPVLTLHEEFSAADIDQAIQAPPPAYKPRMDSMNIDPSVVFWQPSEGDDPETSLISTTRPPSYLLDEGLSYLVDAIATRPPSAA